MWSLLRRSHKDIYREIYEHRTLTKSKTETIIQSRSHRNQHHARRAQIDFELSFWYSTVDLIRKCVRITKRSQCGLPVVDDMDHRTSLGHSWCTRAIIKYRWYSMFDIDEELNKQIVTENLKEIAQNKSVSVFA